MSSPNQSVGSLPQNIGLSFYALDQEEILKGLGTDSDKGLSSSQLRVAQERYGSNELTEAPPTPLWRKFLAQFNDLVIWVLIGAALISGAMGEWTDALAILSIVLMNGLIGFYQEEKAERSLAALQKLSSPMAKVIRNGTLQTLPAKELVPGDIVELEAGDYVPADARLLRSFNLCVQESALTGESVPVEKNAEVKLASETPLAERRTMIYLGTVVTAGKATAVITSTGMQTELGHIAGMLQRYEPEPTPLQKQLAKLGQVLIYASFAIVGLIFILQEMRGEKLLDTFLLAVSLAVAAVPEGLPAVVTLSLALGLQRMVRRHALIRKLPSVETLGSVTVICSDKTGTLTCNEMTVREILVSSEHFAVSGSGFAPSGRFFPFGLETDDSKAIKPLDSPSLQLALTIGARCNNARLKPLDKGAGAWQVVGDPTEGALIVAAMKAGIEITSSSAQVLYEIPFDSERKAMSVVVREPGGRLLMYTKGAPEVILGKCVSERYSEGAQPLSEVRRREVLDANAAMAGRALRVLALAYREVSSPANALADEHDLIFVGLVGMIDPPREEAKLAVQRCHEAGIRPVMITGDHPATALAIAVELNIAEPNDRVVTGQDLSVMSDERLATEVEMIAVYARVTAEHKLRIVKAWQSRGQVVAMTGDGVNDAPAIKAADIGIAMGVSGTDVTKEASAMVLTDDNFASIVNAVEEGRCIFDNIQKVLIYLLSCNCGEILLMLVASLLGWPTPLLPIHLLWLNLISDGVPALALTMEPPEAGIMQRKPRPPGQSMLSWALGRQLLFQGLLVGGVVLAAFGIVYLQNPKSDEALAHARTVAFCVAVYGELFRALAARSQIRTFWQLGISSNPYLFGAIAVSALLQLSIITLPFTHLVFDVTSHPIWEWASIAILALFPVTAIEISKLVRQRWLSRTTLSAGGDV
ncbi:MAG: cation-translocating P-type ATPase [Planctomycetia bacterium]|nr:cation-translocating P-type ATPase [Planctomycetia bacterium]